MWEAPTVTAISAKGKAVTLPICALLNIMYSCHSKPVTSRDQQYRVQQRHVNQKVQGRMSFDSGVDTATELQGLSNALSQFPDLSRKATCHFNSQLIFLIMSSSINRDRIQPKIFIPQNNKFSQLTKNLRKPGSYNCFYLLKSYLTLAGFR